MTLSASKSEGAAEDPFAVLGMSATLDEGAVKHGYFAALKRHPPHLDPEGFRRIRRAYETLCRGEGLMAAYMSRPVEVGAPLSILDATTGREIATARDEQRLGDQQTLVKASLIDLLSRLTLAQAVGMFAVPPD